MNTNKLIFSQVMDHLPLHTLRRCVSRYHGIRNVKKFHCYDQYLVMALSKLTHRESLRDIKVCLRAHQTSFITWASVPRVSHATFYLKSKQLATCSSIQILSNI